jgi:gamma-glutamylcyclotransferase (GGCT)/AIG2-like uncharacterized protein YtfP
LLWAFRPDRENKSSHSNNQISIGIRQKAMPLNFAYGSNMETDSMAARCPGARLLGRGALAGYRFALMPDGYATVVRDPAATAAGVLWECSFADQAALDRYECVADGAYKKRTLPVLREGASPTRALVYIGVPGPALGRAPADYMAKIIAAARGHGFAEDYIAFLRCTAGESVEPPPKKFRAIKNPAVLRDSNERKA